MKIKLTKNGLNFQILLQVLVFGLATKYAHFKFSYKKTTNKEYMRFGIKAEKSVYHQNRKCPHLDHESNYKGTLSSGIHSKIELLLQIQRNRDS